MNLVPFGHGCTIFGYVSGTLRGQNSFAHLRVKNQAMVSAIRTTVIPQATTL
jgi:hypothetical protein